MYLQLGLSQVIQSDLPVRSWLSSHLPRFFFQRRQQLQGLRIKTVILLIMNNVSYLINISMRLSFQYVISLSHVTTTYTLTADINYE